VTKSLPVKPNTRQSLIATGGAIPGPWAPMPSESAQPQQRGSTARGVSETESGPGGHLTAAKTEGFHIRKPAGAPTIRAVPKKLVGSRRQRSDPAGKHHRGSTLHHRGQRAHDLKRTETRWWEKAVHTIEPQLPSSTAAWSGPDVCSQPRSPSGVLAKAERRFQPAPTHPFKKCPNQPKRTLPLGPLGFYPPPPKTIPVDPPPCRNSHAGSSSATGRQHGRRLTGPGKGHFRTGPPTDRERGNCPPSQLYSTSRGHSL